MFFNLVLITVTACGLTCGCQAIIVALRKAVFAIK